jgi:hypothetical protein
MGCSRSDVRHTIKPINKNGDHDQFRQKVVGKHSDLSSPFVVTGPSAPPQHWRGTSGQKQAGSA